MIDDVRPTPWVSIFVPFALGYFLSYLLRTVNAVISPDLTADLALSAADLGLLTSAYFLTFGLAQIPLGIALDRFGPRMVEALLLMVTALGAMVFALGESLMELSIGRGLIGLGVSSCLMAGLKAFALWYPPERQSSMTGFIMAAGAFGALTAATPVEALLPVFGWRGIFWIISILAVGASLYILLAVPSTGPGTSKQTLGEAFRSLRGIFGSQAFLRYAGTAMFFGGGFMALQSLWAVPWLMTIDGLTRSEAAAYLVLLNLGMLSGQLSIGFLGVRLARRGVKPLNLMQIGYGSMIAVEILILTQTGPSAPLWFILGLLSAVNGQSFVAAASAFPREVSGRVSTAVNLMAFAGAFLVQWGLGIGLDILEGTGRAAGASLVIAFATLVTLQVVAIMPLFRRPPARGS